MMELTYQRYYYCLGNGSLLHMVRLNSNFKYTFHMLQYYCDLTPLLA